MQVSGMKYYDEFGHRVPSPRQTERPSSIWIIILSLLLIVAICAMITKTVISHDKVTNDQRKTMDCMAFTYTDDSNDPIKVYVVVDPDTDIQYVVSDHGGICVREGINE